jgi:protein-disulfide isomerase
MKGSGHTRVVSHEPNDYRCPFCALPAYHWADGAPAAVYEISN